MGTQTFRRDDGRSCSPRRGQRTLLRCFLVTVAIAGHAAVCLAANPGFSRQCTPDGCRQVPHAATCRVENALAGGARCLGSGTLVDRDPTRGLVVTCQHIFREGSGTIRVTFPDGRTRAARMVHADAAWDLAALVTEPPEAQPVAVAADQPRRGEPAWSCGYGPQGRYACNQGRVTGYVRTHTTATFETLELTGTAREGDSGGPVFNRRGELVAVLWGTDGRTVGGTACGRVDRFLAETGRYLFPWNARNNPAGLPQQPIVINPAGDLSRLEGKLDRIAELLEGIRQPAQTPSDPARPGPPPEQVGQVSPHQPTGNLEADVAGLRDTVARLAGDLDTLPDRFQSRIDKVKGEGAETTREIARAYVRDLLAEKLSDGTLGLSAGKLLGGALGLSGPLAAAVALGAWLIARRIGRKVRSGDPLAVERLAVLLGGKLDDLRERIHGLRSPSG